MAYRADGHPCPYARPWHIPAPLAPCPHDPTSSGGGEVVASLVKACTRHALAAVVRGACREFPMKRLSPCLAVERSHHPEAPRRRGGPGVSRQRTGMSASARRHRDVPPCRPRYPWPAAAQPGADCSCCCGCGLRFAVCGLRSTPSANQPAQSKERALQPRPRRVVRQSPCNPASRPPRTWRRQRNRSGEDHCATVRGSAPGPRRRR